MLEDTTSTGPLMPAARRVRPGLHHAAADGGGGGSSSLAATPFRPARQLRYNSSVNIPATVTTSLATRLAERLNLRFPVLVGLLAVVTAVDFIVPDILPFVDELGLLLITLLLSRWKYRKAPRDPAGTSNSLQP